MLITRLSYVGATIAKFGPFHLHLSYMRSQRLADSFNIGLETAIGEIAAFSINMIFSPLPDLVAALQRDLSSRNTQSLQKLDIKLDAPGEEERRRQEGLNTVAEAKQSIAADIASYEQRTQWLTQGLHRLEAL